MAQGGGAATRRMMMPLQQDLIDPVRLEFKVYPLHRRQTKRSQGDSVSIIVNFVKLALVKN